MKERTGKYTDVRAITRNEALALAPVIFGDEIWKLAYKLWVQGHKSWVKWEQAYELWEQVATKYQGYMPDYRAINFIAADCENAVYCFVRSTTRNRNEVWIYDGEHCPDAKDILDQGKVIWVKGKPGKEGVPCSTKIQSRNRP
jgi:hypothetical protein